MPKNSTRTYLSLLLSAFFLVVALFPMLALGSLPIPSKMMVIEKDCKDFKGDCVSLEEFKQKEAIPFSKGIALVESHISKDDVSKADIEGSIKGIKEANLDLAPQEEKAELLEQKKEALSSGEEEISKINKRKPLMMEIIKICKEALSFLETEVTDPKDIATWQYKKCDIKKQVEKILQKLDNIKKTE